MSHRVLLTDHPWPDLDVEQSVFDAAGLELVAGPVKAGTVAEIDALVLTNDPAAIMTCWAPVSAAAIRAPTNLRIVARLGVGIDNIAVDAATERGVWVTNVPDYCIEEVSDHAVALLLTCFRGIVALDRETKALRWNPESTRLERLTDLTVGIIGFGRIGRATARKLTAFGCRVVVVDQAAASPPPDVEQVTLSELQEQATRLSCTYHSPARRRA